MASIVTLFNHKGGAGKTTTVYHLAWMFSNLGKRVLMVDADSRCDLTLTAMGGSGFEEHDRTRPAANLKDAVSAAFESRPELLKRVECPNVRDNRNLFILPGSCEITKYELQLGVSISFNISFSTMMNLPGSLYRVISDTAEFYKIDVVLIDLNPGLSALNQTLLFSSNYFIIPCNTDYFSEQALKSLTGVIPSWATWAEKAKEYFKEATYPFPLFETKFLGYTINTFSKSSDRSASTFKNIAGDIDRTVAENLLPALKTQNMLVENRDSISYKLAEFGNFNSLAAKYREYGLPVFEIQDDTVGDDAQANKTAFFAAYETMAKRIMQLIEIDNQQQHVSR